MKSKTTIDRQRQLLEAQTNDFESLPVWYEPKEIYYHPVQLEIFCLPHILDLQVGDYPSQPLAYKKYDPDRHMWRTFERSPYKDMGGSGRLQPAGYFVKAVEIAAEINARVQLIGTVKISGLHLPVTGNLIYDVYTYQKEFKDNELILEAARMLLYISGWKRQQMSYESWRWAG